MGREDMTRRVWGINWLATMLGEYLNLEVSLEIGATPSTSVRRVHCRGTIVSRPRS